ncbi:hypothetical protein AB0M33_02750 [Micrococcus luteus]|uniref:hypothetical protein n=1 Tax=Actinomycetes TaxID=1760 RepID=UPI00331B17AF
MPGPPEHRLTAHPHGDDGWCPICHHLTARRPYDPSKRLTDAECAAHRWQAASTLGLALYAPAEVLGVDIPEDGNTYSLERPDAEPLNRAYDTWHRFATTPHALEDSP